MVTRVPMTAAASAGRGQKPQVFRTALVLGGLFSRHLRRRWLVKTHQHTRFEAGMIQGMLLLFVAKSTEEVNGMSIVRLMDSAEKIITVHYLPFSAFLCLKSKYKTWTNHRHLMIFVSHQIYPSWIFMLYLYSYLLERVSAACPGDTWQTYLLAR